MKQLWQLPNHCARCDADFRGVASTMSRFNTEHICMECEADERLAPNYAAAHQAEHEAVTRGDYNFPGIGLKPEDRTFLALRLADRHRHQV